jgi:hypothetical protein
MQKSCFDYKGESKMITTTQQKTEIENAIKSGRFYRNEKVWTWFIAQIIEASIHKDYYLKLFTSSNNTFDKDLELWFESQPIPPRRGKLRFSEGNTKLDLAFGDIEKRLGTNSGIQYKIAENGTVCFVEAKLFSDCSNDTSYDPLRNQITRVIENLICFQNNNVFPERTYFTLLTPRLFKDNPSSKLYGYKFFEYQNADKLKNDFQNAAIIERNIKNWKYPIDIDRRIQTLTLNWITYEDIIEKEFNISSIDICSKADIKKNNILELIAQCIQTQSATNQTSNIII